MLYKIISSPHNKKPRTEQADLYTYQKTELSRLNTEVIRLLLDKTFNEKLLNLVFDIKRLSPNYLLPLTNQNIFEILTRILYSIPTQDYLSNSQPLDQLIQKVQLFGKTVTLDMIEKGYLNEHLYRLLTISDMSVYNDDNNNKDYNQKNSPTISEGDFKCTLLDKFLNSIPQIHKLKSTFPTITSDHFSFTIFSEHQLSKTKLDLLHKEAKKDSNNNAEVITFDINSQFDSSYRKWAKANKILIKHGLYNKISHFLLICTEKENYSTKKAITGLSAAKYKKSYNELELEFLVVLPLHQNQRIGSNLLKITENMGEMNALCFNKKSFIVSVEPLYSSYDFYKSRNFEHINKNDDEDNHIYEKKIDIPSTTNQNSHLLKNHQRLNIQ